MKEWIERTVNLKNETIRKLMAELEQAEEQYSHNFQSHISHIHNIIGTKNIIYNIYTVTVIFYLIRVSPEVYGQSSTRIRD